MGSSFLLKRSRLNLSREPNNVKAKHSFRYSGIVNRKTVGVEPAKDGKGVVLITKKSSGHNKPAKLMTRVELKRDARKDLVNPAVRRACALIRSQRPVVIKRTRGAKK